MPRDIKSPKPRVFKKRNVSVRRQPVTQSVSNMATSPRNPVGSHLRPKREAASRNPSGDYLEPYSARTVRKTRATSKTARSLYDKKSVDWPRGRNASSPGEGMHKQPWATAKTRIKSMRGANARGANRGSNAGGR